MKDQSSAIHASVPQRPRATWEKIPKVHPSHEVYCLLCMDRASLTPSLEKAVICVGAFVREDDSTGFMDSPTRDLLVAEGFSLWFT